MICHEAKECPSCHQSHINLVDEEIDLDGDSDILSETLYKSTLICLTCGLRLSRVGDTEAESFSRVLRDWNTIEEMTCEMIKLPYHTQPAWRCSACNKTVLDIGDYCQYCKSRIMRVG